MKKISIPFIGIITGILMLVVTLVLFYTKQSTISGLEYIVFGLYALGIAWALLTYYRSPEYSGKFGDIFGKGFRCFIIITLIMVTFAGIFSYTHPEFAEQDAKYYKEYLVQQKNKTPAEIETMVKDEKENYTVKNIWRAAFGYLLTGTIFTAAGAGLLLMRRK